MTAVDFAGFVDRLATVSGEAILPFFRTSLGVENKGGTGAFDPVTAADRAAETAMRALIRAGEPVYGMMHQPFTREHFTGDSNSARYRGPAGDRALHVRRCAQLSE